MGKFIDLIGYVQPEPGRLTVLRKVEKRGNEWYWECECSCPEHNHVTVAGSSIRSLRCKSCGCLKKESDKKPKGNVKDEIGNNYGHLTVIARAGSTPKGIAQWECVCDCGNPNHLIVTGDNLRRGHTRSCGCERRSHGELKVQQLLEEANIPFVQEYRPFKFASGKYAAFDFYVDNKYVIEYDGETHYQFNLHGWHDEGQLKAQQERDIIKNQWCKENHIPLIRIPYWHLKDLCIEDLLLGTSKFII